MTRTSPAPKSSYPSATPTTGPLPVPLWAMLLAEIVATSERVSATRARSEKIGLLADTLRRLSPDEASAAVSFLSGKPTQRRLGAGYATIYGVEAEPAAEAGLQVLEVDEILQKLSETSGPGSKKRKESLLTDLYGRATDQEQGYLREMMVKHLRQGALEGVMADAVAKALDVPAQQVRRAAMLEGDLTTVASRALTEGPDALGEAAMTVFTPVQPMLAKTAETAGVAIESLGEAVVEQKLDGLRVQVHRDGDRVAVFSRTLRDITYEMPGVVEAARSVDAESLILDGEGLWVDEHGVPMSFQDSMSRPDGMAPPLAVFFFDVLHANGKDLIDEPLSKRREVLESLLPARARAGSIVTSDPGKADAFFTETVDAGFEGVVVKDLSQPYEAGRRGSGWLKVKPTYTLDLVILAAEWGSGRRKGWLSNLHLGAVDPDGGFVMLGKTFKGLTDEMLAWQTSRFLEIEDHRDRHIVYLRPEIVYEIAFDSVQRSTRYPGGMALRFARVKRYRDDKKPEDADTVDTIRSHLR